MWKVHLVMVALVIGTIVHGFVAMAAMLHFMWWTAALAGITTIVGVWFVEKLGEEFYQ